MLSMYQHIVASQQPGDMGTFLSLLPTKRKVRPESIRVLSEVTQLGSGDQHKPFHLVLQPVGTDCMASVEKY